jgi:transcriptional regulator with XRE-family HTH domain
MSVGNNLKLLRKRKGLSQEEVAQTLGMNRSTYSGYENGVAQPNIDNLIAFSRLFEISVDELVKNDFTQFETNDWSRMERSWKEKISGSHLRILTSVVNEKNEEVIELIPEKARAGYVSNFEDQQFLQELPRFQLPFLPKDRKYRAFSIDGDSMPPLTNKSIVVGEFVEDWSLLKSHVPCVVVTRDEGIVFKFLYNQLDDSRSFMLVSANPYYKPYQVRYEQVMEIWRFKAYISSDFPDAQLDNAGLSAALRDLQKDVHFLTLQRNTKS